MVEAHGRQICLSISQIKCNNEKIPSFLGMKFFTGLYLGDLLLRSSPALFLPPSSIQELQEDTSDLFSFFFFSPPFSFTKKRTALCMWHVWSTTGPQLKPRDKNIIAVSAGRKRIRALQIGPFPILMGQTCEACAASRSAMERISLK